jgi:hypothetical protein
MGGNIADGQASPPAGRSGSVRGIVRRKQKTRMADHAGFFNSGRGERIRTSGLYVPNVALYQAKLHPEFDQLGLLRCFSLV